MQQLRLGLAAVRRVAVAAAARELGPGGSVSAGLHVEGTGAGWGGVRAEGVVVVVEEDGGSGEGGGGDG